MQTKNMSSRLAIAGYCVFAALAPAASAVTLAEGLSAYRNNHIAEAERMLAEVAADPASPAQDRAAALRELGRIDGLVRGETDAIATAMTNTPEGEERCATAAIALRIYREAGQPTVALAYADAARAACTPSAAEVLLVESARNHLALDPADRAARASHLDAAAADLAGVSEAARGVPAIASARFALAMAQRDAASAFTAWRDYYWLTNSDAPQALADFAGRVAPIFNAGLAQNPSDEAALALIELLVRAGFAADAQHYAAETGIAVRAADSAAWRRAAAYFTFDDAVRAATLRANREIASGGRATWYEAEIRAAMDQLMQAANLSGDPRIALAQGFGVYGTLGETSGYPSLHGGHLVQEERIAVSQYSRSGEVRFIVIDQMLSNGYESWLWDGWAETGGWSSDGNTVVQVRSAYTDGPLIALRRTRPGPTRDRFLADVERAALEERAVLGRDGVAPLPATGDQLLLQAWEQIAARVGDDDSAFIAESWRATNQTSIEAHEGRHALDNLAEPGLSIRLLEYRAKLSQIIFADYPRLGLASVASGQHNSTAHGYGNRRVLDGYRRWMRRNRDEITGFDRSEPTLSQIDKLTDEQIVLIARSLDPWAR
jgi:hypothetical protein